MENITNNPPRMTAEEYFKYTPETNQPTELIGGEIVDQGFVFAKQELCAK